MGIFNNYPYTDFHEMNLDWVIKTLKEIDTRIDELKDEILREAIEATEAYVDDKMADVLSEFADLKSDFIVLQTNFNSLNADFIQLRN